MFRPGVSTAHPGGISSRTPHPTPSLVTPHALSFLLLCAAVAVAAADQQAGLRAVLENLHVAGSEEMEPPLVRYSHPVLGPHSTGQGGAGQGHGLVWSGGGGGLIRWFLPPLTDPTPPS